MFAEMNQNQIQEDWKKSKKGEVVEIQEYVKILENYPLVATINAKDLYQIFDILGYNKVLIEHAELTINTLIGTLLNKLNSTLSSEFFSGKEKFFLSIKHQENNNIQNAIFSILDYCRLQKISLNLENVDKLQKTNHQSFLYQLEKLNQKL